MPTDTTDSRAVGQALAIVGEVLIPAGVLTALLYYFGYVRERALFGYFGVDLGSLEFTTTDYIVRSAGAVFAPLAAVSVIGVVALVAHSLLVAGLGDSHSYWWRVIWCGLAGVALVLLVVGAFGLRPIGLVRPLIASVALGASAVLLEYSMWMASHDGDIARQWSAVINGTKVPRRVLLVSLAVVAAFWSTANIAHQNGVDVARAIELSVATRAEAVVFSGQRLQISGPGVDVRALDDSDSPFAFQYIGLRILVHTESRWFLLPAGWRHDNEATVVLLPDDLDDVRVDLRP